MKNIRFQLMNHILSRKYSKYYQLCDSLALAVEPVENKRPIWKQLYWKTTSNVSVSAFPGRLCLCSVSLLRPQNVPAILFRASFRNFWGREKSTNLRSLVRLSESAVTLSSGMPPEDNEKSKSLFYIHPPMCTLGACLRLCKSGRWEADQKGARASYLQMGQRMHSTHTDTHAARFAHYQLVPWATAKILNLPFIQQ